MLCLPLDGGVLDPAGMHVQHAVAARRERGVVGDQNERRAALAVAAEQ